MYYTILWALSANKASTVQVYECRHYVISPMNGINDTEELLGWIKHYNAVNAICLKFRMKLNGSEGVPFNGGINV